ncbi:SUMO-activating enzyme subunit 1 [Adelges cooleyi]|uniref:SUMO-activating enzyme subunit 1 n=1 Tax=Adelges cooleyi TaxID=133065 RepID=UPI00217F271D|nr:SUMO-activating enzyme subunit 1 [Adelges cooleyi]XP_050422078.1 SUMO-activating enzyme subunit 1 [Adelges cooleyi]
MATEVAENGGDVQLTADERKVYDRQIRLWGYDAQKKLRTSKVLLIGLQGLGAEIAKNLILSGIHSITLKDHTDVSILDTCSQFLIGHDSQERNRAKASVVAAQKLNPNVVVTADTTPIDENDENFVKSFDVVIATECSPTIYEKLNKHCKQANVKLFIADVYGLFGYMFQDIGFNLSTYDTVFPNYRTSSSEIECKREIAYYLTSSLLMFYCFFKRKPNPETCEEDIDELKSIISSLEGASEIPDEYYSELFCQLSPATSIVGAMVAQTATNAIMGKSLKNYNLYFYDHINHQGKFEKY